MIKILGDINFSDGYFDTGIGIGSALLRGENPFIHLKREAEDFWIGNFECVCSSDITDGRPFVVTPKQLDSVCHLDFYGIANNHVMQAGAKAYQDLISYLEKRAIGYAGSNYKRSAIFEHQGQTVGIIVFSQRPDNFTKEPLYWHLPEYSDIVAEIQKLQQCDYKIIFVHWGYEFINYPNLSQKKLAHWLVDSGADLIVGMHPHVAQGCEIYKGKPIFYSLGNAVFNMPWLPTKYGLIVSVDLSGTTPKVFAENIFIGKDNYPSVVSDISDEYSLNYLNRLLNKSEEDEIYFANAKRSYLAYRKINRRNVLYNFAKMKHSARIKILNSFIKRRLNLIN